ncbi:hypothetical protein ACLI4Z_00815 [Natrialbaceae archaeon A-arb3/5]
MIDGSQRTAAPDAFADRATDAHGESIRHLVVFGDAVRDDDRGVHATMDVLLVLEEDDPELERALRGLAQEVGLEHGLVVSVYVLPADRFEATDDHPFVETAFEDGRVYV